MIEFTLNDQPVNFTLNAVTDSNIIPPVDEGTFDYTFDFTFD